MKELSFVIHPDKSVLTPSQTKCFSWVCLGNIVASFPAVTFGALHYRHLERDKIGGLKDHKGNFEGKIRLSWKVISEIHW